MRSDAPPGPFLRLTAIGASAATLLAVVSGALHLGTTHRALSALALPPLVALVVAAIVAHRRLVVVSLAALVLFGAAAILDGNAAVHLAAAAAAFGAALVATAATFRGDAVPSGPWRDYVALTKPRIMSLLLLTGACGMLVGERGVPPLRDLAVMLVG
ncbi:MAG: hypothetical protein M3M94_02120, partial [Actinomycetota bacterium]|nr:hypothetical protein [Actinomycetota bacterium]